MGVVRALQDHVINTLGAETLYRWTVDVSLHTSAPESTDWPNKRSQL